MEALVRWDGPTAIEQQRILEKQSFVGIPQYGLNIKSDGHVFVELRRKTSDIQDATSERLVELGTATHIVATYDGFAIQIYINGTLDKTQPIVPPEVDLDIKWPDDLLEVSLVIGDRYDSRPLEHRTFNGLIDEVAIYSQALSPDRIRAHAMAAFPK